MYIKYALYFLLFWKKSNFEANMQDVKLVDIENLIASKNPKILKWTPRFVLRYLKKILHQDEVNDFISKNKDKKGADWCKAGVDFLEMTYSVKNIEKIPKEGKIVIAMNHPLGGMDAIVLIDALKDHRKDLKFIVNDLLMNIESMEDMFVGVDKYGKAKDSIRTQIKNLFQSDNAVCIFPAGLVSRETKGEVKDLVWKKTFVTYSKDYERTIVPIYIEGKLSPFFYRLSRIRKFFGIKMNIEMLYLSNELFKQRGKHINFVVGDPIEKEYLFNEKNDRTLSANIKNITYALRNQL
tara:strand:- start:7480 stop:8364 length:885 start_codon:yes stop_codon:yes gene_type:complete